MDVHEIYEAVQSGRVHHVQNLISQALSEGIEPSVLLMEALIPAIDDTGRLYKQNEVDIAVLLSVARCVQRGMDTLTQSLRYERQKVGSIILGTVEGDLHDVGKNLVAVMLRSYGFDVIDLGVDVSGKCFVRAALEHPEACAVCLSYLITTSMPEMRRCVRLLRSEPKLAGISIMIGGAPITQKFADDIGADIYTDNAVDAAEVALKLARAKGERNEAQL